jgi:multiple antibiotic resistance protein
MTGDHIFFLQAVVSLFALLDPIGVAPIFVFMTPGKTDEERRSMARRASVAVLVILAVFAVSGGIIFTFLGISIAAFRIAGGLILLKISLDMIEARISMARHTLKEGEEGRLKHDIAIIPLSIPLLAGPGSISGVIVLMSRSNSPWTLAYVLSAILIATALTYAILRSASRICLVLGETGQGVFVRIMGLILAAVSVEFIISGIREYFY